MRHSAGVNPATPPCWPSHQRGRRLLVAGRRQAGWVAHIARLDTDALRTVVTVAAHAKEAIRDEDNLTTCGWLAGAASLDTKRMVNCGSSPQRWQRRSSRACSW